MTTITQSYSVRLRKRGQVTIPQSVRDRLAAHEGDMLTLVQIDDLVLLMLRQSHVAALTEQFTDEMDKADLSLTELPPALAGS